MQYKDYYKLLEVERSATAAQIKSSYRKLTKKYHPDVNKATGAQDKFKDINEAYEVLSDKEKRKRYDSLGANWQANSEFTPPPGFDGFNFNQGQGYGQTYSSFDDLGGFSDFFKSIFGDFGAQTSHRQGASSRGSRSVYEDLGGMYSQRKPSPTKKEELDFTQTLLINAKDVFASKPIVVKLSSVEQCMKCLPNGTFCHECGGTKVVSSTKTLNVKLPKGVKEGQKVRLAKEGKTGVAGQKGDLYLVIKISDKEYLIDGFDVTKQIEVTPSQAVLGCNKEIETLHGKINIKIPAQTQSGAKLRLSKLGLPDKSGSFGNLNVKILINIPKDLSNEAIELYKKLANIETK